MGDLGILERNQSLTLQEYITTCVNDHVAINLKGGAHRIYEGIMRNHCLPALGSKLLAEITRAEIRQVITEKVRAGMGGGRRGI